jgi:prophage DNA circulation protein
MDFSIDLAQHKKPNVPGAKIEGLGSNPITFHVKALFINNLLRGPTETWDDSTLFPGRFLQVVTALLDDSAGAFVHPTLGSFNCKPVAGSSTTSANERNGQTLEFQLVVANTEAADALLSTLELGLGYSSAAALDSQLTALVPPPSGLPTVSFSALINNITSIIGQTSLLVQQLSQVVNGTLYQLSRVELALQDLDDVASAPIIQNVERTKSAVNDLAQAAQKKFAQLLVYSVPAPITLALLAAQLNNTVESLLNLNPDLAKGTLVTAGSQVVYSKAA